MDSRVRFCQIARPLPGAPQWMPEQASRNTSRLAGPGHAASRAARAGAAARAAVVGIAADVDAPAWAGHRPVRAVGGVAGRARPLGGTARTQVAARPYR